jgi:DNA-binding LacI/PurR family transcriptional regulator
MREMGRAACRKLFDAIEAPRLLERTEFPMELIVRESTGPAPGGKAKAALHLVPLSE